MTNKDLRQLQSMAEEYRQHLPHSFFVELDRIESECAGGRLPITLTARGGSVSSASRVGRAVMAELYIILCKNDPAYRGVRKRGSLLTSETAHLVAGLVAGKCAEDDRAMLLGAAAFLTLAVARMGLRVFCRLAVPARFEENAEVAGRPRRTRRKRT